MPLCAPWKPAPDLKLFGKASVFPEFMQRCAIIAMTIHAMPDLDSEMAQIGLKKAADLTGKSQSTIHRAAKAGKLSCVISDSGERLFDIAELERVFGVSVSPDIASAMGSDNSRNAERSDERAVEMARLQAKLEAFETRLRDLESDRDAWRDQAKQLARLAGPIASTELVPPQPQEPGRRSGWFERLFRGK